MPWRPFPFVAEAFAPTPPSGQRRVLINGVVFRRDADVSALCVTCPHEQCQVDFVADAADLARIDGAPPHPVFECGCHASVFDAAKDGARISGETPRGLYRFQIEGITGGMVNITAIEEVALSEV